MIVDYTSGGAPIGLTWEGWEEIEGGDDKEEQVSDEDFYESVISDSLEYLHRDLSQLDGRNIMVMETNDFEVVHESHGKEGELEQLFEFFIQWKAGNLAPEQLWNILHVRKV